MNAEQAAALRAPFPADAVGHLRRGDSTLEYVGHAAVTDRLLAVDPEWTWEPVAMTDEGSVLIEHRPAVAGHRRDGSEYQVEPAAVVLWIRLTVCGVTRFGVGTCATDKPECEKQLVSDAIRNAAMRFGVGLDLWSKEDLAGGDRVEAGSAQARDRTGQPTPSDAPAASHKVLDALRARRDALSPEAAAEVTNRVRGAGFDWPYSPEVAAQVDAWIDEAEKATEPF